MRGFDAIKRGLCRVKGFKAHHRMGDFPDGALILSNQVIKVFNLYLPWSISRLIKLPGIGKQLMLQPDMAGVTFVHDDFSWNSVRVDGLFEKRGNHRFISKFRKYKANGIAN
jgi:hypothetical protein